MLGELGDMLFDMPPWEPAVYLWTAIGLAAAMLAATYVPARRAARADPAELLRS